MMVKGQTSGLRGPGAASGGPWIYIDPSIIARGFRDMNECFCFFLSEIDILGVQKLMAERRRIPLTMTAESGIPEFSVNPKGYTRSPTNPKSPTPLSPKDYIDPKDDTLPNLKP